MNTKMIAAFIAIALVASMGVVSAGTDFTCAQLVELGMLNANSISYGTLYLPQGAMQINGCLFYSSEKVETGLLNMDRPWM